MAFVPSTEKINDIVKRRLLNIDSQAKAGFPSVLDGRPIHWLTFGNDSYLGLLFVDNPEKARVDECMRKGINPLAGFITTTGDTPVAFKLAHGKFNIFSGCVVKNMVSFSVGPDSTFIVFDHQQVLEGTPAGELAYKIPLAYVLSYGSEITQENVYEHLEDLIAYSIKSWRSA